MAMTTTRYTVRPMRRRARARAATVAGVLAALVVLGLAGRADFARECADVMAGSDHAASIDTCRDTFGSRGY